MSKIRSLPLRRPVCYMGEGQEHLESIFSRLGVIRMGGRAGREELKTADASAAPQSTYSRISDIGTQATVLLNAFQVIPVCSQV